MNPVQQQLATLAVLAVLDEDGVERMEDVNRVFDSVRVRLLKRAAEKAKEPIVSEHPNCRCYPDSIQKPPESAAKLEDVTVNVNVRTDVAMHKLMALEQQLDRIQQKVSLLPDNALKLLGGQA